ncbi:MULTISPECIES: GntR family transcriptional regulator [unclassified Bradyrhizobium]|jgi:DNA-binding GntR family transcriptional regulator|uniref:GntR family transcriptional regulator n=1 Tax=unclassified Bradyrhizobium TaxID=2631580 RepID=UPI0009DCFDFA|nr:MULTISPECIES: GntR family transcriptional regulator [unclassified Bradyrhizobium]AUC98366.1 GntR family transcriptional regulator [Bradyrhizobium sp. SK17]
MADSTDERLAEPEAGITLMRMVDLCSESAGVCSGRGIILTVPRLMVTDNSGSNPLTMFSQMTMSRREEAYERVLEAIVFGDLAPGSAVDEKGLAQSFDIGLAGIRDALARLEIEGMVERQPRIGTKIAALGVRELQDLYEMRVMVEPVAANMAAKRAEDLDIRKLLDLGKRYREIVKTRNIRELVGVDQQFHRSVAAATKNAFLERQITVLSNNALRFWYANSPRMTDQARRENLADHLEVIAAIQRRDAEGAERAMRHLLSEFPKFVDFRRKN